MSYTQSASRSTTGAGKVPTPQSVNSRRRWWPPARSRAMFAQSRYGSQLGQQDAPVLDHVVAKLQGGTQQSVSQARRSQPEYQRAEREPDGSLEEFEADNDSQTDGGGARWPTGFWDESHSCKGAGSFNTCGMRPGARTSRQPASWPRRRMKSRVMRVLARCGAAASLAALPGRLRAIARKVDEVAGIHFNDQRRTASLVFPFSLSS